MGIDADRNYHDVIEDILVNGKDRNDRTGEGTRSIFGRAYRYDCSNGKIPLLTTKKVLTRAFIHEMLWFISGSDRIEYLKANNVNIWDSWVIPGTEVYDDSGKLIGGSLNKVYGMQWRRWEDTRVVPCTDLEHYLSKGFFVVGNVEGTNLVTITRHIDQLQNAINQLRNNPDSRRILVSAWNPGLIEEQALPPCHWAFQFYSEQPKYSNSEIELLLKEKLKTKAWKHNETIKEYAERTGVLKRKLHILLNIRSNDCGIGKPFNSPQYALLLHMVAQVTGHVPGELIYVGGDMHLYQNQLDIARGQIERQPINCNPVVKLNPDIKEIDHFTFDDILIEGYLSHPAIKYPAAAV